MPLPAPSPIEMLARLCRNLCIASLILQTPWPEKNSSVLTDTPEELSIHDLSQGGISKTHPWG
ncbi:unnamed protein product [Musa hybrid cultivar]